MKPGGSVMDCQPSKRLGWPALSRNSSAGIALDSRVILLGQVDHSQPPAPLIEASIASTEPLQVPEVREHTAPLQRQGGVHRLLESRKAWLSEHTQRPPL